MSWETESSAGRSQSSDGYSSRRKTGSFAKMQGLSSRAHAFSVEALVGKPCKRMKVSEGHESSSAGDTGNDTSIFTGERRKLVLDFQEHLTVFTHVHFTHKMEQLHAQLQTCIMFYIYSVSQIILTLYFNN